MITGGSKAADAFLFARLTTLSASWPRREAGRCPKRHQRARCTVHRQSACRRKRRLAFGQLCGRSRASTSTFVDTGSRSRICTCMPFDLRADISIEVDAREPLAFFFFFSRVPSHICHKSRAQFSSHVRVISSSSMSPRIPSGRRAVDGTASPSDVFCRLFGTTITTVTRR